MFKKRKIIIIFSLAIIMSLGLFLKSINNLDFKIKYSVYSFFGSKEKIEKINNESIEAARQGNIDKEIVLIIHGAGASYDKDVYGTALWFKKKGMLPVSFNYDYEDHPDVSAKKLDSYVKEILDKTGRNTINIYGICLGGVLARYYSQEYEGASYVNKLVTVISPAIPIPKNDKAYLFDKYFSFDPEPWNDVLVKVRNRNPVENHLYIYCKNDIIVSSKYQYSEEGNYKGLECGHSFVNVNPIILKTGYDFLNE